MTNETTLINQWRQAVAQDLRQLAILHSRELTLEDLNALEINHFPDSLGFYLPSENGQSCLDFMKKSLANTKPQQLDELAMDFAGIYLNHHYRISPCESVWFDDEGLMLQEAMFAVRECYQQYGLEAENWRIFPDDHFILQIQFVAHLLALDENKETLANITRFLDEHLLRWISKFAAKVSERCTTDFYAGLNILTAQYLEEVRDMLAAILETPRPTQEEIEKRLAREKAKPEVVVPLQYLPGVSPSW
jgi:putative dimethyl sulfoxide reductase chaperone